MITNKYLRTYLLTAIHIGLVISFTYNDIQNTSPLDVREKTADELVKRERESEREIEQKNDPFFNIKTPSIRNSACVATGV